MLRNSFIRPLIAFVKAVLDQKNNTSSSDQNDISILQKQSFVGFYLDHLALKFPNLQVVPLSISHTTRVTQTTNIGLENAFTSTFGTRRLRAVISYQSELFAPFLQKLEYDI